MRDRIAAALAGQYLIEQEIGRGGMATVWLARDLRHDRQVALKVLHPELASAIGVDRFVREVRLTARLQHPAIIPVLDSGVLPAADTGPLPWYAMAYVRGESLRARLSREQALPIDDAVRIAREVASALDAAHSQGVIHRDVKPENVLLAEGHVYVVDFGIAKALFDTGDERLTSTGLSVGTPAYMSPEQASAGMLDARSDQYSLAAVLYEMLAGEAPFTGPSPQAVIARRLAEAARPIRSVRPAVPEVLEAAVLRGLERIPADRFPNTAAFAAALDAAAVTSRRRTNARPWRLGVVLAAVVIIVALGSWAVAGRRGRAATPVRDPAVVSLYESGMRAYDRRTPQGVAEAIAAFSAAIQRDSSYSRAWTGLARAYTRAVERRFVFPGVARDSVIRLAVAAIDRGQTMDSNDAELWTAQAVVTRILDPTDVTPAIRAARKAIAIDSSNGPAWHLLAVSLAESGQFNEALTAWRRCVVVAPAYTQGLAFLGLAHYWRGQYDSAAFWADSAVAVDPSYLLGRSTVAYIAVERGDFPRARAGFETSRRLTTDVEVVNALAGAALTEVRAHRLADGRRLLREVDALSRTYDPTPMHTAVYVAQVYAALGDVPKAVGWLRRYAPPNDLHYQLHLRCDPPLAPIAGDPRFRDLLLPGGRDRRC